MSKIKLSRSVFSACNFAINYMAEGTDPLHNQYHVLRIVSDLVTMHQECQDIEWEKINFDVLLLSICWHDAWISHFNPQSKKSGTFGRVYEGYGSMRLFNKWGKKFSLPPLLMKKVKYCIRKHSLVQIFPRLSTEAKILHDLDKLDEWSIDRLQGSYGQISSLLELSPKTIRLYKFYFEHLMLRKNGKGFSYQWSRQKFITRRKLFTNHIADILKLLAHILLHPHSTASSPLVAKNWNQESRNLKMILNGDSSTKSKTNTKKLSLETPLLNKPPTTTIGSINKSINENRFSTRGR